MGRRRVCAFTFHYVSISTESPLHDKDQNPTFTFHYVSISTIFDDGTMYISLSFTFHYVSISTLCDAEPVLAAVNLHSTMYLFQPGISTA